MITAVPSFVPCFYHSFLPFYPVSTVYFENYREDTKMAMGTNEKKSKLWDYIVEHNNTNPHFLRVAKQHIARLLEYSDRGPTLGPETFKNEEEYRDFAVSKFFLDKGLQSLKRVSNPEAEEGEIGSDDEDSRESSPLVIFPLTKLEQTKQTFVFWEGASVGDIYIAKVVAVGKKIYDLMLLNKSDDIRTVNVFSISAFLLKESIIETLEVDDLVRVAILGHIKRDDLIKMKVTADPSEVEGLENKKLGKIYLSELVQTPSEYSSNIHWGQIYRNDVLEKNHQNTFDIMSLLGIDPYKPYCFLPDVKGSSTKINRTVNQNEVSAIKEKAIDKLKVAIQVKEDLKDLAKDYATEAIKINPDYDLAYAIRGSITIKHAEDQDVKTIMGGVTDCMKSLELNPYNEIARKELSSVLVQCAVRLSKDEASFCHAKDFVEKALEFYETEEAKKLHQTLQSLMDVSYCCESQSEPVQTM